MTILHTSIASSREAGSTGFLSAGQFATPMVVRIASFAYQRGIGGGLPNKKAVRGRPGGPRGGLAGPGGGRDPSQGWRERDVTRAIADHDAGLADIEG